MVVNICGNKNFDVANCTLCFHIFNEVYWQLYSTRLFCSRSTKKTEKRIQYRCIFFTLCKVVDSFYIFERQDTNTRWQTFLSQLMVRLRFFFSVYEFSETEKKSKKREKKMTVSCHATYRIKSIGRKWKCEHTH